MLFRSIRNLEQAKEYQKFFEEKKIAAEVFAIEVALTDEESFNRLTKRRVCQNCGEIIPWIPATYDLTVCPKCEGELVTRADDDEDVIRKRIVEQGNIALKPILDYYQELNVLKRVDGMKDINGVEEEVNKILKS